MNTPEIKLVGASRRILLIKWMSIVNGALLFLTGAAKLISSAGGAKILAESDPVFGIKYINLFLYAGLLEVGIGIICIVGILDSRKRGIILLWLSVNFCLYRAGMAWIDSPAPCGCLGTLTQQLHLSENMALLIIRVIFIYTFITAVVSCLWGANIKCQLQQGDDA